MSKSSCITHPPRQQIVLIREDYVAICDGNHCAAAILNVFEYWTNIKLGQSEQASIENQIAAAGNVAGVDDGLWIYKSVADLKKELIGLFGDSTISKALTLIQSKGLIEQRNNPKYGWDRTLQYLFKTETVQSLILTNGSLKSKKSKASKVTNGSRKNNEAIPKTTTETTHSISGAKKPRPVKPMFEMVALKSFGIADTSKLDKQSGSRIGMIYSWLKKHEATEENLTAFYMWYARETKQSTPPRDVAKFAEWYLKFEETVSRKMIYDNADYIPVEERTSVLDGVKLA